VHPGGIFSKIFPTREAIPAFMQALPQFQKEEICDLQTVFVTTASGSPIFSSRITSSFAEMKAEPAPI
jgi:hypothetical protein